MMKPAFAIAILLLLAACGGKSPGPAGNAGATARPAVAPAITPPDELADQSQPPSYEVAIASAAAEHNGAMKRCASQPAAVRAQCDQEANAAFAEARAGLDHLRGNQP